MFHRCILFVVLGLAVHSGALAQSVIVRLPESLDRAAPDAAPGSPRAVSPARDVSVNLRDVRELARGTERVFRGVVLRGALDPAITGRSAAPTHAVALEVGKEGETVGKARLAFNLDGGNAVDVVLQGPINKQSAGVPLTDRGLAGGASATFGYSLTLWGNSVPAATLAASGDLARVAQSARALPEPVVLSPLETMIATGLAMESDGGTRGYADPALQVLSNQQPAFAVRDTRRIASALWNAGTARLSSTVILRGSYGVGVNTFKYAGSLDPVTEVSTTETDHSKSVNLSYVRLLRNGEAQAPLMLVSVGYAWSDAWKGADPRQICAPRNGGPVLECQSLVLAAPTEKTAKGVEVDVRSWAYEQKLGINPHFSYDEATGKWSSEVGLSYLVLKEAVEGIPQLDAKAMTVGVRVGSRPADAGGVYASVYFGTVLSK